MPFSGTLSSFVFRFCARRAQKRNTDKIGGTIEIWESVYEKDVIQNTNYRLLEFEGSHRGTFCVWELAPVWHEKESWERFLISSRDVPAAKVWQEDVYAGAA